MSTIGLSSLIAASLVGAPQVSAVATSAAQLESPDQLERERAADELARLGAAAEPAIPALVCAIYSEFASADWSVRGGYRVPNAAGGALVAIGVSSVPELVKLLGSEPFAYVGQRWGGRPCGNRDRVLVSEGDSDVWTMVSGSVGQTLAAIGQPAVASLAQALQENPQNEWVAQALAKFGAEAEAAVPALIGGLRVVPSHKAGFFVDALGAVGPGAAEAAPLLIDTFERLPDDRYSGGVRTKILFALGEFGPAGEVAVPFLSRQRKQPDYSEEVQDAFWKIQPADQSLLLTAAQLWRRDGGTLELTNLCRVFHQTSALGASGERLVQLLGPPSSAVYDDVWPEDVWFGTKTGRLWFRKDRFGKYRLMTRCEDLG